LAPPPQTPIPNPQSPIPILRQIKKIIYLKINKMFGKIIIIIN